MIEKLSATAPDPSFRDSILPRACRAIACGFHAAGCKQIDYLPAKLAVTIQNRVAVRTRFRKCLPQLLHYPGAGRVFRDVEMEDLASTVFDDGKTIQNSEGEGWHGEKVHGRNGLAVIPLRRCLFRYQSVIRFLSALKSHAATLRMGSMLSRERSALKNTSWRMSSASSRLT